MIMPHFLPLNEDETAQDGASIELVRVTPYQNEDMEEDYMIESITTEAELQTAKEAFEQLIERQTHSQFEEWLERKAG